MKTIIHTILLMTLLVSAASAQYQFLGSYNADGVPDYLDGRDTVSNQLLANIAASLPEGYPVPTYNPHLISSGYDTDVRVLDSADVWVTFVQEGAGYRNVLGFFTYDINNPYQSAPPKEDITIVFPNVSAQFSGGGLVTGDRVKIGTFPANTGIGWVLMANGWNGSSVTDGNWILYSNPDFNPEVDSTLRYHNVLLNDTENDLIVLGFEDIRRDYASCDNDFNDAIFYVTANPIEAIARDNFAEITESTEVSSGNDGGLESNGDLATAIAARSFQRESDGNVQNVKARQSDLMRFKAINGRKSSLDDYFPEYGFTGNEQVFVSSPTDLVDLTNAKEVFAADYYSDNKRVSAALVTATEGGVYNHNKHICDRLNGAEVKDARYVDFNNFKIIFSTIKRENEDTEYAAWFSAKEDPSGYDIISLWNIGDYPTGDYLNFQVWGATPAQVFSSVNHILNELHNEKEIRNTDLPHVLPQVYVKSGSYHHGKLELEIYNNSGAKEVSLISSYTTTEFSNREEAQITLSLSGAKKEKLVVEIGSIFDAGISIKMPGEETYDALYLADGAWGIDFNETRTSIQTFDISPELQETSFEGHLVERGFEVTGRSNDVVNVFRNLKPGNGTLNISDYSTLAFDLNSNVEVEVSLVEAGLTNWDERLIAKVTPATSGYTRKVLELAQFERNGQPVSSIGEVQSVVFSFINTTEGDQEFSYGAKQVVFGREQLVTALIEEIGSTKPSFAIYPNPADDQISVILSSEGAVDQLEVFNLRGEKVMERGNILQNEKIPVRLPNGLYIVRAWKGEEQHQSKLMIR